MQISVRFFRADGLYRGFSVSGHDAVPDSAEYSVLCAAVSSAVQLTCNTLTEIFGAPADAVQVRPAKHEQNEIALRLPEPDSVQSEILRGLHLHLQLLSEEYAGRLHICVREQ